MEKKVLELEIDAQGRICLPDFLIRRLCLRNSVMVPLLPTNMEGFLMPSAFSAMLLESGIMDAEKEKARTSLPKDADDDHEWTEEEIVAACKELRRAVNAKYDRIAL